MRNITKNYKNKIVLENVSFSIYSNQIIALVGKNGSGKSILLKIIGGLIKSDSGEVYKLASPLKMGYVPELTPSHIDNIKSIPVLFWGQFSWVFLYTFLLIGLFF
ncbi:ATP-binding cassette domain-containing protein [Bacillus sp. JZ8]